MPHRNITIDLCSCLQGIWFCLKLVARRQVTCASTISVGDGQLGGAHLLGGLFVLHLLNYDLGQDSGKNFQELFFKKVKNVMNVGN